MYAVSVKDRVIAAITESVLKNGRAATVQQGAEMAYEALSSAGLLVEEQDDIKTD
jgi:thiamine phosphate synthase YjbQ (UPF0047 family)